MTDTPDQAPGSDQLFYDLQQFLFDARDQYVALDELKSELTSILETITRKERAFGSALVTLQKQVNSGVTIHADRNLTDAVAKLTTTREAIQNSTDKATLKATRAMVYLPIAAGLSALVGSIIGIFIGIRLL